MENGTLLFYSGIILTGAALFLGLIAAVVLWMKHRWLNRKLDQEYGVLEEKRSDPKRETKNRTGR